jgi:hypothetical protein
MTWLDVQLKQNTVLTFSGGVNEIRRELIATAASPSGSQVSHQTREPPSEFTPAQPGMRPGAPRHTTFF